jgi:hypothetical protein
VVKHAPHRLVGLLCAAVAFVPASTSLLKGIGGDVINSALNTIPFHRTVAWMPAILCPIDSLPDLLRSMPGIAAILIVGLGLYAAFAKRKNKTTRRWEKSP